MHGIFLSYVVLTPPKLGPLILTHFSKPIFELNCTKFNWSSGTMCQKLNKILVYYCSHDWMWRIMAKKKNEKCCQIWLRKEQRDKIMHEQWNEKKKEMYKWKSFEFVETISDFLQIWRSISCQFQMIADIFWVIFRSFMTLLRCILGYSRAIFGLY